MRRKILVTGGSGFMGSNFIRFLYKKYPDLRIINYDALTYAGNPDNLLDIEIGEGDLSVDEKRYHFIRGNVCDGEALSAVFQRYSIDTVFHFAAETHVDRSIFNASEFVKTNVEGTRIILEVIKDFPVHSFMHISTDEVYGSVPEGFSDEQTPLRPSNPYAASKASAEFLIQAYTKTYEIPAIVVRGSNVFGPYQYPEKLVPLTISNLIEGKKIPIHGTGEHVRSWLHVFDFCSAVDIISCKGRQHNVYNISGEAKTNLEIIEMIANCLDQDTENCKENVLDRPGADLRYAPDSTKLEMELGWSIKNPIEKSIGSVVDWYRNNANWWKKEKEKEEYLAHYEKQSKALWC